jgi:hypothetical protein
VRCVVALAARSFVPSATAAEAATGLYLAREC